MEAISPTTGTGTNDVEEGIVKNWFNGLTRQQAGIIGGFTGYVLGVVSGPVMKLLLAIGVLVLFGFVGRHIEKKFESRLGIVGVVAAILACTTMGPIQRWTGHLLGGIITNTSRFAFAILGVYFVLQLHDQLKSQDKLG